jgi:hypothetical protein
MSLRLLALAALLCAGGCLDAVVDANRPATSTIMAGQGPLTGAQKAAWKALCRQMRDNHQDNLRLAVLTTDWHWQVRTFFVDADSRKREFRWELAPGSGGDEQSIRKDAIDLASRAQYRCTAVLDLFGGDEPRFVSWFGYEGKGVREYTEAPTTQIADSARQYLLEVQRRARDLR